MRRYGLPSLLPLMLLAVSCQSQSYITEPPLLERLANREVRVRIYVGPGVRPSMEGGPTDRIIIRGDFDANHQSQFYQAQQGKSLAELQQLEREGGEGKLAEGSLARVLGTIPFQADCELVPPQYASDWKLRREFVNTLAVAPHVILEQATLLPPARLCETTDRERIRREAENPRSLLTIDWINRDGKTVRSQQYNPQRPRLAPSRGVPAAEG